MSANCPFKNLSGLNIENGTNFRRRRGDITPTFLSKSKFQRQINVFSGTGSDVTLAMDFG